jgi:thymidylate kinase
MNLLSRWASETLFGIRMRRPFLVVFTGPDGSGKTTLAEAGMLALEATAEKPKFVWLRVGDSPVLNFLKKFVRTHIEVTSNEKKFGGELKSSVLQTIWLWLSAMDWFFRSFFLIRIPLWLRRIVICDRYLVDALVDLSYRSSWDKVRKSKLIRMLIRLTTQPDIIFQCIAPADIILNRRSNEITEVDANQIVKSYSKAKKYLHKSVPIDSTQPEEKNKTAVVYKILKDYYASYESKKS